MYGYEAANFKFVADHSITAPQNKTSAVLLWVYKSNTNIIIYKIKE